MGRSLTHEPQRAEEELTVGVGAHIFNSLPLVLNVTTQLGGNARGPGIPGLPTLPRCPAISGERENGTEAYAR